MYLIFIQFNILLFLIRDSLGALKRLPQLEEIYLSFIIFFLELKEEESITNFKSYWINMRIINKIMSS